MWPWFTRHTRGTTTLWLKWGPSGGTWRTANEASVTANVRRQRRGGAGRCGWPADDDAAQQQDAVARQDGARDDDDAAHPTSNSVTLPVTSVRTQGLGARTYRGVIEERRRGTMICQSRICECVWC